MSADLEAAIRRALALLNRASSDWRQAGGDSGPLHWPTAVALATRELRDALGTFEPPAPRLVPAGEHFPGCERLAREIADAATATAATSATGDAAAGMAWWNNLTPTRRREWLDAAGSAVPADAWRAFLKGCRP